MKNLSFNKDPLSYDEILDRFTNRDLASPTRSTIPLLDALRRNDGWFQSLLDRFSLPNSSEVSLEHQVASRKGVGKNSHTDAMVLGGGTATAIEAKWTEPRYPTVRKWRAAGSNPANREKVIEGWLELLAQGEKKPFDPPRFDPAIYQMLHRAASACNPGGTPRLVYLLFGLSGETANDSRKKKYLTDLQTFYDTIGWPKNFPFVLVQTTLKPSNQYLELQALKKGELETGRKIREALKTGLKPFFSQVGEDTVTVL